MNPVRHSFLRSCLASHPPPKNLHLLDIGCGGGIFAESAARLPDVSSVTAIDPSPEVLRVAQAHQKRDPMLAGSDRLRYLLAAVDDVARPGHQAHRAPGYDVVSVFEVLEHVATPSAFLDQVCAVTKPGGWVVMSTIARTWMSWMVTNVMAEDVLGIVPKGTHDWNKYINPLELSHWFATKGGWGQPKVLGVVYVPGAGWKVVPGSESVGNYFFGVQKNGAE